MGHTFTYFDAREYNVATSGGAEGTVKIADANHPTAVTVNREFSWYLVGHVENATVHNPGIAYAYIDGPASSISLIRTDGSRADLPKGYCSIMYYRGDKGACTNIDSRNVYRGAIFPAVGTYKIWLLAGRLSDDEAAAGRLTWAGLYEHVTSHFKALTAAPVGVTASSSLLALFLPFATGAFMLLAVR